MNKKAIIKIGTIGIIFSILIIAIFLISNSSAISRKDQYTLGEKVKLDLREYTDYKLKISTPYGTIIKGGSNDVFAFEPEESGNYKIEIKYGRENDILEFKVISQEESQSQIPEEKNKIPTIPQENEEQQYETKEDSQVVIEKPVKNIKKLTTKNEKLEYKIPKNSKNITVSENGKGINYKIDEGLPVLNFFSKDKEVLIENSNGEIEIQYYTKGPIKEEKIISDKKKEVTISSDLHYQNVLAYTSIDEALELKQKDSIEVYWKEEDRYLDFKTIDENENGIIDKIEWTVPHLSTQTFEIIVITKAEHLDSNRDFIEDIYGQVKTRDNIWASILDGEYIRIVFEQLLDKTKDITIYAKSQDNASIEVYEKGGTKKIAEFKKITTDGKYQILLNNLVGEQDTFDLLVKGGTVQFDYVVDPIVETFQILNLTDNTKNTAFYLETDAGISTPPAWTSCWNGAEVGAGDYTNLENDDDTPFSFYASGGNGREPFTRFNFTIDISQSDVNYIQVKMKQREYVGAGGGEHCYYYVANFNTNNWDAFGTQMDGTSYVTRTANLSTFANYISGDQLVILSEGSNMDARDSDGCGVDYVEVKISYNVTINNAPTHSTPILNSSLGIDSTNENLTVYNQSTSDVDGDYVKNIFNWRKDGAPVNVLNMPFEGGSNSTFTKDYSGLGNDGTINGPTWNSTGGYDGLGAYSFDGAGDYISSGFDLSEMNENWAFSAWIKWKGGTEEGCVFGEDDSGNNLCMGVKNNLLWLRANRVANFNFANTDVSDNAWHHVVFWGNSTHTAGYLDGTLGEAVNDDLDLSATGLLWLGARGPANNYFTGMIDDVQIFNHSLSDEQILALSQNRTDLIVSQETSLGETWQACVTPNDGYDDGTEECSGELTILSLSSIRANQIQCEQGGSFKDCSEVDFGEIITRVRTNCTFEGGLVVDASFNLTGLYDNYNYFLGNASSTSGTWQVYDNADVTIEDSGGFNLASTCYGDDNSSNSDFSTWTIDWGTLSSILIDPSTNSNITTNQFSSFTSRVTCNGGECGDINATLDPQADLLYEDWEAQNFNDWTSAAWTIASDQSIDSYSAKCVSFANCDMSSGLSLDTSSSLSVNLTFRYMDDQCDGGDVILYFNDSSGNWDNMGNIDAGSLSATDDTWNTHTVSSTDSQYLHEGFAVRFFADPDNRENYWLDNINLSHYYEVIGGAKGVIPMNSGDPFYTTTMNPMNYTQTSCLENMAAGDSCNTTWQVNATGLLGSTWEFFTIYKSTDLGSEVTLNQTPHINLTIAEEYVVPKLVGITKIWPLSDEVYVEQNALFNVTLNITCLQGDCGTINVTLDPTEETYNDFETGTEGFEHFQLNAKNDQWHLSTEEADTGTQSWKVGDTGTGDYLDLSESVLVSPTYDIIGNSTFSFYHHMDVEVYGGNGAYDGGYLQYQLDGGSWKKVTSFISGGYNTIYRVYSGGPPLVSGEPVWGDGTVGTTANYQQVVVNMTNITQDTSSENVSFRFHFFADASVNEEGWYIDSVNFTTQTPDMNKGIIPVGLGNPFYTTAASNPLTTSPLSENQSQIITFFVNATGDLDSKYIFFAYTNLTSDLSIKNTTSKWNVTISVEQELPNITILYPTSGAINDATPVLNINLTGDASELWYNIDGGANKTLCTSCSASNNEVLYLREASYIVNVFASNPMGEINSESVSFNVDMNNNYFDSFLDSSQVIDSYKIDKLFGNITLQLKEDYIINETFEDSDSWTLIGGRWETSSGELVQTIDTSGTLAIYNDLTLNNITNYNISFEMYAADNDQSGLIFGYEDPSNYYRCRLYQQTNQGGIEQVSSGTSTTLDTATTMYNLNQWNTFLVEIDNKTVNCYINGVLTSSATDVNFPEGGVGIFNANNLNVRHDDFTTKITGGKKIGNFTAYSVGLINPITKFTNIRWNSFNDTSNSILEVQVSANDGLNWYTASKNSGLSTISSGSNFLYRVFFEIEDISILSLLDLNISWSNNIEAPPEILIEGIDLPIEQDFSPMLNITLIGTAVALTMSINGGANATICTECTDSHIFPVILEEGAQSIKFYANNSQGTMSTNSTSFTVDFDKHYYDEYLDNSSIRELNNVVWAYGNITLYVSSQNTTEVSTWDANDQTGDAGWANSGRNDYSFRNILEAGSINDDGDFVRLKFISGTDSSLRVNNPTICERSGSTSDCVSGTWQSLTISGSSNYLISSSSQAWTDWINYSIDSTSDYLVTFYMDTTNDGVSYLSPASAMLYSISGSDESLTQDWSGLAPASENLMYGIDEMEVKSSILGGQGNFTSHTMNTSQEVTSISYAGWTETGVSTNNNISLELSVDNGLNWNSISNGGSLTGFTSGSNLVYRLLYSAISTADLSVQDLNITWESPPTITILYPGTYVYNFQITKMNYSIAHASGVTLDTCWYSLNGGTTNTTITCGNEIISIASIDGSNTWTIYANDSSGSIGQKSITFIVDTSAPIITFINQTDESGQIVDSSNALLEGSTLTINANVTDSSLDKVWVVIWENIIGGVKKARLLLTNIIGSLWSVDVPTDETYGEKYNYTIYANDTTGLNDSYNGTFDILKGNIKLSLNPNLVAGSEIIYMTGVLNFSNGTTISNNAINFWLDNVLISFENITSQGSSSIIQNFNEDDIKILSSYDNITYSGGEFTLDSSNTSGSLTGILDAGALVNWQNVSWSSVAQACSGTVDYQDGNAEGYLGTEDSYITSGSQTTNFGSSPDLIIDSSPDTELSIVKFKDIVGYGENKIPYYSTINSATLRLTLYDTGDNPTFYEILEDWEEAEADYIYRTNSNLWGSEGLAGSPSRGTSSLGSMSTATVGTKSLDISSTLSKWTNKTIPNYGLVINPSGSGGIIFRSSEYTTQTERPRLSVDFTSTDCNGVLVYVRTSKDKSTWSSWTELSNGEKITDSLNSSRYLEYKVELGSYNETLNPRLQDLNFNYSGTFTDSFGFFNYSFISTDVFGNYKVNVTSGFKTIKTNAQTTLSVQSGVPPEINLLAPPNETWSNENRINLTYNATDGNGDFFSSLLVINNVANQTNQTTIISGANNFTLIGLTSGVYIWGVNLSDITSTVSSESRLFYIDTQDPTINLMSPQNESGYTVGILNLTFNVSDNMDSELTCDIVLDGIAIESLMAVTNDTETNVPSGGLSGGTHYWNVTCTDEAQNIFTSQTWQFNITDTPPTVVLEDPEDNYINNTGTIEFWYTPSDNSGIDRCELIINGEINSTNSSIIVDDSNLFNISGLADNIYNWTVKCFDLSETSYTASSRTLTVDINSPTIILISPANESISSSSQIDFQFNVTDSMDSELNCSFYIDGSNQRDFLATSSIISTETFSGLSDGVRTWKVECLDDAGHLSSSETRTVNITEAPIVYMNSTNSTYVTGNAINAEFTPYDNTQISSCSFYLDGALNTTKSVGLVLAGLNSIEVEGIEDGRHTYYIQCSDGIGLSNSTAENEIFLDNSPPTIIPYFPINEDVHASNISFKFKAIDSISSNLICNLTVDTSIMDENFAILNTTNTTRIISGISDGTHLWNITCSDLAGNTNTSTTLNFTKYTTPDINLVSPSDNAFINTSTFNLTYFPQDDEGFQKSELIINNAVYIQNQSEVLNAFNNTFTVTLLDGIYDWGVNVTDTTGLIGESEIRRIYVDTSAPIINPWSPSSSEILDTNNATFNFTVSDNLDSNISCSLYLDNDPEWNGIAINATNTIVSLLLVDGNHSYQINCTDDARNSIFSSKVNFTVFAPPRIELVSPLNKTYTANSTINFSYIPIDAIGLNNCTILIDEIEKDTSVGVVKNIQNNFSIPGILEGEHNWSVQCIDSDENINRSESRIFYRDITPPSISLTSPENNSGIDANNDVTFVWTATDILDNLLICDLTVDGNIEDSSFATSGFPRNELVSGLSVGQHYWNVTCSDEVGNTNTSQTRTFNYTYPDLYINETLIQVSNVNPKEDESIIINATILNLGGSDASSVGVKFYNGDPETIGTQIGTTQTISIEKHNSNITSITWDTPIGSTNIFVIIDFPDTIIELNESNNKANTSISVSSWNFFYGKIRHDTTFTLTDSSNYELINWNMGNLTKANIYVTDSDSSIEWSKLQAIGKTISGSPSSNDIQEIDSSLSMTSFKDSHEVLYLNGSQMNETLNYTVFTKQVTNVPVTTSINSTDFKTGILWDYSDDSNTEYDITEKEDIVYITSVKKSTMGSYEVVDYELRVPANLRSYNPANQETAIFYLELA